MVPHIRGIQSGRPAAKNFFCNVSKMSAWIVLFYDCYLWNNRLHIWAHYITCFFFCHASTALVDLGLFCEVRRSYSDTPHSIGLLWTSDRLVVQTSTWQHTTLTRQIFLPLAGFEPAILANERQQTHALDRATTEIKSAELYSSANMNDITKLHFFATFHRCQFANIRNTFSFFFF